MRHSLLILHCSLNAPLKQKLPDVPLRYTPRRNCFWHTQGGLIEPRQLLSQFKAVGCKRRGTIRLETNALCRNVPDSKNPKRLVLDDAPNVIHKLLERLMRGELPDEVATRTQDLLRLAESDEAKSFEGLVKLAEREGITDR